VRELRELGLTPVLLTGDHESVARSVAAQVGIEEPVAVVVPQGKVGVVRRFQEQWRVVAMVGDGVNAAALAQADLGLGMGTGPTWPSRPPISPSRGETALGRDAIRLSRPTLGIIGSNLRWAFATTSGGCLWLRKGGSTPLLAGGRDGPLVPFQRRQQPAGATLHRIRRHVRHRPQKG